MLTFLQTAVSGEVDLAMDVQDPPAAENGLGIVELRAVGFLDEADGHRHRPGGFGESLEFGRARSEGESRHIGNRQIIGER